MTSQANSIVELRKDLRYLLVEMEGLRREYKYWSDIGKMNNDTVALDLLPIIRWEADQKSDEIAYIARRVLTLFGGSSEG